MKTYLVVTLACPDRPGIVERLTEVIAPFSANWEDSRMARLGGEFAGIVLLSVPAERAGELERALLALHSNSMTVVVKSTQIPPADDQLGTTVYVLRLNGADHEGIVQRVSTYLASRGINVEDLETEIVPAPVTATPLFSMTAKLRVPPNAPADQLRENLERIAEELGVDVELTEA